jgi:hypothetical protein
VHGLIFTTSKVPKRHAPTRLILLPDEPKRAPPNTPNLWQTVFQDTLLPRTPFYRISPRSDVCEIDRAEAKKKDDPLEKTVCSSKTVSRFQKETLKERITNSLSKVPLNSVRFHLNLRKKGSSVQSRRNTTEVMPLKN